MGASAGHGALTAPMCDFVAMTKQAAIFAAGPPLVKAAIGEVVTKEALGGPDVHVMQSGLVHNLAEDDAAAFDKRMVELLLGQRAGAAELQLEAAELAYFDNLAFAEVAAHHVDQFVED